MNSATTRPRIESIDLLRGLVMALMMLDHTRDFFTAGEPADLATTTPALFFTRWITHLCAPVFVFLAGTSAYLRGTRGHSRADMSRFLLSRGLWLIFLEFTLVRFCMGGSLSFGVALVIWAIGASMGCLAGLIWLPLWAVAAFGLATIGLHNLLDGFHPDWGLGWSVLHERGRGSIGGWRLFILYPLIPWVGVMATGYAFGQVMLWEPARRRRFLGCAGAGLLLGFVLLRVLNRYGDPQPWRMQDTAMKSIFSFLNVEKYPPSLFYLMIMLGLGCWLLTWLEHGLPSAPRRFLLTLGQVPLFFYLLQWLAARGLSKITGALLHRQMPFLGRSPEEGTGEMIGVPLWGTYLAWIIGLALLYPLCRWFANLRQRRRDWWLSYL